MKSNNFHLSLIFILATGVGLSACGGGGGGGEPTDASLGENINAVSEGRITGLWGGNISYSLLSFDADYLYLIADHGSSATVYDCLEQRISVFDVVGDKYNSRDLNDDEEPTFGFKYRGETADKIGIFFGSQVEGNQTLNILNISLPSIGNNNKFSLNSDAGVLNLPEVSDVCGGASIDNGSANLQIVAPYADQIIELNMIFKGGADAAGDNSLGENVSASMSSRGFEDKLLVNEIEFTMGSISLDTCTMEQVSGTYTLTSIHGEFTGSFSLANTGLDICGDIEVLSSGEIDDTEVTSEADCTDAEAVTGLTGVWTMSDWTKFSLRLVVGSLDELSEIDPATFIDIALMASDNEDTVGLAVCETDGSIEVDVDDSGGLISNDLNSLFIGDDLVGDITVKDNSKIVVKVNAGLPTSLPLTFEKRGRGANNVCMSFEGMDPLPIGTITCIDKPLIALSEEDRDSVLHMGVVSGEDIYRIVMHLGVPAQVGTYDLASESVSAQISSPAFVGVLSDIGVLMFEEGIITIIEKTKGHVKGKMDVVSTSGTNVRIDFYSTIY